MEMEYGTSINMYLARLFAALPRLDDYKEYDTNLLRRGI